MTCKIKYNFGGATLSKISLQRLRKNRHHWKYLTLRELYAHFLLLLQLWFNSPERLLPAFFPTDRPTNYPIWTSSRIIILMACAIDTNTCLAMASSPQTSSHYTSRSAPSSPTGMRRSTLDLGQLRAESVHTHQDLASSVESLHSMSKHSSSIAIDHLSLIHIWRCRRRG